jgi:hypothetical protein
MAACRLPPINNNTAQAPISGAWHTPKSRLLLQAGPSACRGNLKVHRAPTQASSHVATWVDEVVMHLHHPTMPLTPSKLTQTHQSHSTQRHSATLASRAATRPTLIADMYVALYMLDS